MLPDHIKKFIALFSTLPSLGTRQATRLAFTLITGGRARIEEVAQAVADLRALKTCAECFFVHANKESVCDICRDPKRNPALIMIIEKETDLISLEKTKRFHGRYLVLGQLTKAGTLESAQKLRLAHLKESFEKRGSKADEIILALNPTSYGDVNAAVIAKVLEDAAQKITRLGRGIPTGGEIEFADDETLGQALERRI